MTDKLPGRSRFPNCTIDNVQYGDGFDYLRFDILDADGTYLNKIYVCNRSVQEDLQQLFAKPAICLYWAYGMVDIDVSYKAPDVYCIDWSPYDGVIHTYEVSTKEIKKLMKERQPVQVL